MHGHGQPSRQSSRPLLTSWNAGARDLTALHQRFFARDVQAARRIIRDFSNGQCNFSTSGAGPFKGFREARVRLSKMWIRFLSWECASPCEAARQRAAGDNMVLQIPLTGRHAFSFKTRSVEIGPGQLLLLTAAGEVRRRWTGSGDLLSLMLDRRFVEATITRDAGVRLPDIDLLQFAVIDLAKAGTLVRIIDAIIQDLHEKSPALRAATVAEEFQRLLVLLLFQNVPGSLGHALRAAGPVLPGFMRKAERHLCDYLGSKVTISRLSLASGVSARTLYYGFRRYLNTSPRHYTRVLRLKTARQALEAAPRSCGTVQAVARQVGYANSSQFSRDYKSFFGVSPRETLQQKLGS